MSRRYCYCLSLFALVACGDKDISTKADASQPAPDAASGLSSCEDACAEMTLSASFGDNTIAFERAFFGLSAPAQSTGGVWEVYLESSAGGESTCPTMSSPPPQVLLRVAGLAVPSTQPEATSGVVNLFDFDDQLLSDSVFASADTNTVHWAAADLCVACAEGSEDDRAERMLALDIEAVFPDGRVSGHIFATHCDSLDLL